MNVFPKLYESGNTHSSRVQDSIDTVLRPVASAVNATPIGGAPPPAWVRPVLVAPWLDFGGEFAVSAYHKDALGYVHLKGVVMNTSGGAVSSVVTVLPPGFRPAATNRFSVGSSADQTIVITLAGSVTPNLAVPGGNALDIGPLSFLAEM